MLLVMLKMKVGQVLVMMLRVVRLLRRVRHGGRVLLLLEGQVRAAAR